MMEIKSCSRILPVWGEPCINSWLQGHPRNVAVPKADRVELEEPFTCCRLTVRATSASAQSAPTQEREEGCAETQTSPRRCLRPGASPGAPARCPLLLIREGLWYSLLRRLQAPGAWKNLLWAAAISLSRCSCVSTNQGTARSGGPPGLLEKAAGEGEGSGVL